MGLVHPETLIRSAVPDDADAIAGVLDRAFAEYEANYTPEAFAATIVSAAQLRDRWHEGPVWVAVEGVDIVGAVPTEDGTYMRSMAVLPACHGRGIGWALLEVVERYARELGHGRMTLSTTPDLIPAIRLYERFGFHAIDAGRRELFGTTLFTMVKLIASEACPTPPATHPA